MKRKARVCCALLALLNAAQAYAHGGKTHIMGTLTSLDAEHVVVKDRDDKSVSIRVTKDTAYEDGEASATAADLKLGEPVVVEVTGKDGDFSAATIRFGSSYRDGFREHH